MHLAFSSKAFSSYSLIDCVEVLSYLGYSGIEIMADAPHAYPPDLGKGDIKKLRGALLKHSMKVSNMNAFMSKAPGNSRRPSWIDKDPALRQRRIEYTKKCIELACELGCATVTTEPGGPLEENMGFDEGLELFLEGLAEVEGLALQTGVRALIGPEPGLLIGNSAQFEKLFGRLNPQAFGLDFDIGHFFCSDEAWIGLIKKFAGRTGHFHLGDAPADKRHRHLTPGQGAIDFPAVFKAIRDTGYEGFGTVELNGTEEPALAASISLDYLGKVIEKLSG